jgi:ankyrin repeat protein
MVLLLILLSGSPSRVSSQGIVTDTNYYHSILLGPAAQNMLDYELFKAASQGNSVGIDWLVRHGADINAVTPQNVTPVIFAVSSGEIQALKTLLKYDPDLDVISAYNESALIVAVKDQKSEITELLLRDSANVNLQDKSGFTALHYAAFFGYLSLADMLLYYDADVNIRSKDGITPLMAAAYSGYPDVTDLLLQNRARVLDADSDGFTAMMLAAQNGDTLIIDLLLRRGADIRAVNKYNYDALALAIRLNYPDAVKYLLKKKIRPGNQTSKPVDPYAVAAIYKRDNIINILKEENIPGTYKRGFDQVSFTGSAKFCFHNIYTGFSVTLRESKQNIGLFAGLDLEPFWSRVLVKDSEDLYYQYMDKSYLVYGGVLKELSLTDNAAKGNWFFGGSLAAGYSFGNEFKGTNIKPDSRLRIIPAVGFRYNKKAFNFQIGFEYTNTEYYKIGPIWLRTGLSFNIDFNQTRGPVKVIKW